MWQSAGFVDQSPQRAHRRRPRVGKLNVGLMIGDAEVDDGQVYNVAAVLDSRWNNGEAVFRVRWEGFSEADDTWEPSENLTNCSVFQNYLAATPAAQKLLSPSARWCPFTPTKCSNAKAPRTSSPAVPARGAIKCRRPAAKCGVLPRAAVWGQLSNGTFHRTRKGDLPSSSASPRKASAQSGPSFTELRRQLHKALSRQRQSNLLVKKVPTLVLDGALQPQPQPSANAVRSCRGTCHPTNCLCDPDEML